jgi:hypothetical protein
MNAAEVLGQNDGDVTKAYYADLASRGPIGRVAVALLRSQKRSARAKVYRRGKWRRAAYDVKQWGIIYMATFAFSSKIFVRASFFACNSACSQLL